MQIEQIYTGCLAQGAYYIESKGEAVVIDPLRETEPYLKRAKADAAHIKYILETHFHADFVSGHLDLANKSGATIVYGPTAKPGFPAHVAQDGEQLKVGELTITVLHTPGHTMESSCYLLTDGAGKDIALFTGDTLFIGDVGRPDLAQKLVSDLTQEKLAGYLYDSLHTKILPLADDIIVYPAHGAGSACGKNMSKETTDTLGHQKATNYALQAMDRDTFITKVTEGLMPAPGYFPMNVLMNIKGYDSLDVVRERGLRPLSPDAFDTAAAETAAVILDTRDPILFGAGFVPNSINIGINGNFAPWVGTLIPDIRQPILIVADPGKEEEVVTRLARVGYDQTIGFLEGGFASWKLAGKNLEQITTISVTDLRELRGSDSESVLLDVRKQSEHQSEHVLGSDNMPLDYANDRLSELNRNTTYYVHCASGYRSMIFCSILKGRGFNKVFNVDGGFKALKESKLFPVSEYVCPTTLL